MSLIDQIKKIFKPMKDTPSVEIQDDSYLLHDPRVVGWMSTEEQEILFNALTGYFISEGVSILDVGCGRGDLFGFLSKKIDKIDYTGIDSSPSMILVGNKKFPSANLQSENVLIFAQNAIQKYDWVVGSGLFNLRSDYANLEEMRAVVDSMYSLCSKGIAFNLLTGTPSDISDSDKENLFVHNAGEWLNYLVEKYQTGVVVRADYMLGDITFILYK